MARLSFILLLLLVAILAGWQWHARAPLSSDLFALLPAEPDTGLTQRAEARLQTAIKRDLIVLVSHPDPQQAKALAADIGQDWRNGSLFADVHWTLDASLNAIRQQLLDDRLALLPPADRQRLEQDPAAFVAQRVDDLLNPVGGMVSPADDWFGLTSRLQQGLPSSGQVHADPDGTLVARNAGQTWVVVRARTAGDAFDGAAAVRVAQAVEAARAKVDAAGGQLLATGAALYAAQGERQARTEMNLIGGLSAAATIGLLLALFRRPRILLAALPVPIALLFGTTACVALFGQIHVLVLVLGASLIGVAIDYPLHVLSKSWGLQPWSIHRALRLTRPGLTLALGTNLIGYLALAFTPFPALKQVAVFSSAGLVGAYLATLLLLPWLVGQGPLRPWAGPLAWAERLLRWQRSPGSQRAARWLGVPLAALLLAGLLQVNFSNDVRQWVSPAPALLSEARAIAERTGIRPTSQFFLVRAPDEAALLERERRLGQRLDRAVADGRLGSYLSLGRLLASPAEQARLREALPGLLSVSDPLLQLGIERPALVAEVRHLQAQPDRGIDEVLGGPLGEPWRPLWLGRQGAEVASIVSLQGLSDGDAVASAAEGLEGVAYVDRIGRLGKTFADTQRDAAALKVLSCLVIFVLLAKPFGFGGSARIVLVSLLAATCSVACLGWLGQPLTLFGVFGLLLVTAIGVDYAILLREGIAGLPTSLLGVLSSAVTTWLSFGLLALSSTPAVSSFGITISLGLLFNFLLAPWIALAPERTRPTGTD